MSDKDVVKLERPYNSMDIANHVVQHFIDTNREIKNILLVKILYYLQADSLRQNKGSLFNEKIEKWGYGAVEPVVYSYFKSYGAAPIDTPLEYVEVDEHGAWHLISPVNRQLQYEDTRSINKLSAEIYTKYGDKPFKLVIKTQNEPMWYKDKPKIRNGNMHIPYENKEIIDYFSKPENWSWDN